MTISKKGKKNVLTSTTTNATDSTNEIKSAIPEPICTNFFGNDVWFKINVVNDTYLTIETSDVNTIADTWIVVYSGDLNNLSLMYCNDDNKEDDYSSKITLSRPDLVIGQVLYIRAWIYHGSYEDFKISEYDGVGIYSNDNTDEDNIVNKNEDDDDELSNPKIPKDQFNYFVNAQGELVLNSVYDYKTISIYNSLGQQKISTSAKTHNTYDLS